MPIKDKTADAMRERMRKSPTAVHMGPKSEVIKSLEGPKQWRKRTEGVWVKEDDPDSSFFQGNVGNQNVKRDQVKLKGRGEDQKPVHVSQQMMDPYDYTNTTPVHDFPPFTPGE